MTPQKKAIELVERMAIYHWVDGVCKYEEAKQCALIAVDEIIDLVKHIDVDSEDYWEEVKQEIINL